MRSSLSEAVSELRSALDEKVVGPPKHNLKVGSILVASWGYDQTNIDFYEVTALLGPSMVTIREIDKSVVPMKNSPTQDSVMPRPGQYDGEAMRKKVSSSDSVRLNSFSSARPWDGKPQWQTASGYGH